MRPVNDPITGIKELKSIQKNTEMDPQVKLPGILHIVPTLFICTTSMDLGFTMIIARESIIGIMLMPRDVLVAKNLMTDLYYTTLCA